MVSRKSSSVGLFAFVTKCIAIYVALTVLVGCSGNKGQPSQPKPNAPTTHSPAGPLTEAKERVLNFEKKRRLVESHLKRAFTEQDELKAKLREAGVNTPADLKGNLAGQKLAEEGPRIVAEIEGLKRQIAEIESAIFKARSVVRKVEREEAGISDEEMLTLAMQMRVAEERMDGSTKLVTPLDVESALKKLLSNPANSSIPLTANPPNLAQDKPTILAGILQEPGTDSEPQPNLSGRWIDEGKGIFDVKHEGDILSWRGKSPDGGKQWSNVFDGRLVKNGNCYLIVGSWKDVPPGRFKGHGMLMLLLDGSNVFRAIDETGGYGGTVWIRQPALNQSPRPMLSATDVKVEELNQNPAKYKGQTIQVIGQVSGAVPNSGMQRFRLYVKGEIVKIDASRMQHEGINFILPKSKLSLLDGLIGVLSPVKLTVTVNQGIRGNWLATVSNIEKIAP